MGGDAWIAKYASKFRKGKQSGGAPGRTRTFNLPLRRGSRYPIVPPGLIEGAILAPLPAVEQAMAAPPAAKPQMASAQAFFLHEKGRSATGAIAERR